MMFLSIIIALIVAFFWANGEIGYSKLTHNLDRANVYMYQYLSRTIIYLLAVLIFDISLFTSFDFDVFLVFLPIILCDLFASYVVNISVINGKLTVVSPIMASYPIVDIFLDLILLKEKIGIVEIVLSIIIAIAIMYLASIQKKSKKAPKPLKGIIFAIVYMLLVAFSVFFEKSAYIGDFSMFQLYYYKGLVYLATSIFFWFIVWVTPVKIKKPNKMIIRGSFITPIGNVLNSFALSLGNMIIVTPISSIYSVLSSLLSVKILKEKISIKESICISTILIGTILLIVCGLVP